MLVFTKGLLLMSVDVVKRVFFLAQSQRLGLRVDGRILGAVADQ